MKNRLGLFYLCLLGICPLVFQSCLEDKCTSTQTFVRWDPIYMTLAEIRSDIQIESPKEIQNPGKIYFYNDYILINELKEGIHIIDNSTPADPTNIAYIGIPGNLDMAVKNDILYADNYTDLLTINISDIRNPNLEKRQENVFNQYESSDNASIIVDWQPTSETKVIDCHHEHYGWTTLDLNDGGVFMQEGVSPSNAQGSAPSAPQGIAGSMARFGLYDEYLYAIDNSVLEVFDISVNDCPEYIHQVEVGWGIETLFPYKDKLFIGAVDGMYIYDNADPKTPEYMSKFRHSTACDPVFVQGNIAYVTLRDGNECAGFDNQLDVVNIENLLNPFKVRTYPMDNPHGLSIRNEKLFICEGSFGLKSFDATVPGEIVQLGQINDIHAYDAILLSENHLLVIGKDGLYQFDVSDMANIKTISHLSVNYL